MFFLVLCYATRSGLCALAALVFQTSLAARQVKPGDSIPTKASTKKTAARPAFDPTERYQSRKIQGWTVLVNKGFLDKEPDLAGQTLALLTEKLRLIVRRVPAQALVNLRKIRIWVEENEPHHPCMTYHPAAAWLIENGMNPEKARCVELSNARNFLEWSRQQPWMVLHELRMDITINSCPKASKTPRSSPPFARPPRPSVTDRSPATTARWKKRMQRQT